MEYPCPDFSIRRCLLFVTRPTLLSNHSTQPLDTPFFFGFKIFMCNKSTYQALHLLTTQLLLHLRSNRRYMSMCATEVINQVYSRSSPYFDEYFEVKSMSTPFRWDDTNRKRSHPPREPRIERLDRLQLFGPFLAQGNTERFNIR